MKQKLSKILMTLAAVLLAAGAWAQNPNTNTNTATPTGNPNEWSFSMPASDVQLRIIYKTETVLTLAYNDKAIPTQGVTTYLGDEAAFIDSLAATVTANNEAVANPEVIYKSNNTAVIAFGTGHAATGKLDSIRFLATSTEPVTLTAQFAGNDDLARSNTDTVLVTVREHTYTVTLDDGDVDAAHWQAQAGNADFREFPLEGVTASQTVTVKYTGTRKVKSIEVVEVEDAPAAPEGAINGKFSVNANGKQVYFSKGNLRYTSNTWSFFDNQYDYYTNYSANAWDHFGWSTTATNYGMSTSSTYSDYHGTFVDWGSNSALQTSLGTGWRTLTSGEWTYLFNTRSTSTVGGTDNGRYAKAKVNNVEGVILFPDTYTHPDGVTAPDNVNKSNGAYTSNNYSTADWAKMESAGCVFLPAAGCRTTTDVFREVIPGGIVGQYWSSTPGESNDYGIEVYFGNSSLDPATNSSNSPRSYGHSVRLVREAE